MKKALLLVATLLLLAGCGPKKDTLKYGKIIPVENGIALPMSREPGGNKTDWNVGMFFTPEGVVIQSPCELHTCAVSVKQKESVTDFSFCFPTPFDGKQAAFFINGSCFRA